MTSKPVALPLRYFTAIYAGVCAVSLITVLVISTRVHFHGLVQTHCGEKLTSKQEASFRNWRFDVEWWPSISAVIGDNMPERAIWRVTLPIILPFFAFGYYYLVQMYRKLEGSRKGARLSDLLAVCVVAKMLFCFGYTYIASFEQLLYHEVSFGLYIVFGFTMQIVQVILTRRYKHHIADGRGETSLKLKVIGLVGQTTCALAVLKFFVFDHTLHCIPGAYSRSNMFEWTFALFNLAFDATVYFDLGDATLIVGGHGEESSNAELVTWWTFPSQALLWTSEVALSYLLVASFLQMAQQVYFIPMVAMEFTPEVLLILTPPCCTALVARTAFVRSLVAERPDHTLKALVKAQLVTAAVAGSAIFTMFHVDVLQNAGAKIIVAAIGPHVLLMVTRVRGLLLSSKVATLAKLSETSGIESQMLRNAALEQHRLAYGVGLGFVVNVIVRYWGISLDPFMIDPIYNAAAIIVLALLQICGPVRQYAMELRTLKDDMSAASSALPSVSSSCAFGALFALALTVSSAHGTTARYVGIDPIMDWWAPPLTIVAALAGTVASSQLKLSNLQSLREGSYMVVASVMLLATSVLYYGTTQSNRFFPSSAGQLEDWYMEAFSGSPVFAFVCGGLLLQFTVASLWPHVTCWNYGTGPDTLSDRACDCYVAPPAKSRDTSYILPEVAGFSVTLTIFIASVYVVCFPFVPLGFLLRDRMDIVLFGSVIAVLAFVARLSRKSVAWKRVQIELDSMDVKSVCKVLLVVTVLVCGQRNVLWTDAPSPLVTTSGTTSVNLTAAIWTVHFANDNLGVDSHAGLAKFLRESKAQVIGMLESDMQRTPNGNHDLLEYLAHTLGYRYSDHGPTTLDSTFGCALLSQFPIRKVHRIVLPSPMGELSCLIHAWVEVLPAPAPLVHVYVGHWGNTQHVQDLVLQSHILGEIVRANEAPSVFLGYLTTPVGYKNYYRMIQSDGDEEDDLMRVSKDDDARDRDDGTKTFRDTEDGHKLPRIPIVKRRAGLFRDVARDILRANNPFSGVNAADHIAQRDRDLLNSAWPTGTYWKVHAVPTYIEDDSLDFEGRVGSPALRAGFASNLRDKKLFEALLAQRAVDEDTTAFRDPPEVASLSRLQRAAEFKARKMTLSLKNRSLVDEVPETLRPALRFLENSTRTDGRASTSMVYEYPNTGRVTPRHPRHEYEDRYCQQLMYKLMPLLDWYRVLDIDELSDTELQVVTFSLSTQHA